MSAYNMSVKIVWKTIGGGGGGGMVGKRDNEEGIVAG